MTSQDRAHQTIDQLADSAHDLVDRFLAGASPAADDVAAVLEGMPAQPEQLLDTLGGYVEEHPLAAVAAALVVGYAVSRVL